MKPALKHTYYALRHAESIPNTKKIIVSDPQEGVKDENGLSNRGIEQVKHVDLTILLNKEVKILSSDFSRAMQTASLINQRLLSKDIKLCPELRERYFGIYDGKENQFYHVVWNNDVILNSTENSDNKVESVESVHGRVKKLVEWAEDNVHVDNILLVSHGDTLQIAQCYFEGIAPHLHRSLPHLETCEIRQLNNKS